MFSRFNWTLSNARYNFIHIQLFIPCEQSQLFCLLFYSFITVKKTRITFFVRKIYLTQKKKIINNYKSEKLTTHFNYVIYFNVFLHISTVIKALIQHKKWNLEVITLVFREYYNILKSISFLLATRTVKLFFCIIYVCGIQAHACAFN